MEIVFWLGVVPLVGLIGVTWAWTRVLQKVAPLAQLDSPLESLPPSRRALRVAFFPSYDMTPEGQAAQLAEKRHREIVSAIHNANATDRRP